MNDHMKTQMKDYWTKRAPSFSALRVHEYQSEKRTRWEQELFSHLPKGRPLRILDIGTGTGFFAFLLAAKGHRVTGIDLTPGMIEEANRLANEGHFSVDFRVMDAEHPTFPPESFDALVTRNLTWTLPHLKDAYRRWHRLLKPGGIFLNFDADYCRESKPDHLPQHHAHQAVGDDLLLQYEAMKDSLRPLQKPRPFWDVELLEDAGFCDIRVDTSVWQRIYREMDEFYNPTPIFTISARA